MTVKSTTKRVCSECGFKTMLTLVDDEMSIISSKNIASIFWLIRTLHPKKTENLPHFYTTGVLDFFPFGFFRENNPFCCPLVSTSSHDWRLGARGLSLSSHRDLGSELQFSHWTQLPQGPPCHGTLPRGLDWSVRAPPPKSWMCFSGGDCFDGFF